jgi:hypothetical protein
MIALLSYVIPYGIAFKLIAVLGCLSLPFCAYFFGRMTRLAFPVSPLLAVGATLYLFDQSFTIYGGNIASTLAGEFSFSLSLSFAMLYLGVLGRGLETGRHRGWAALLLALCGLCHLIPFIFALVGTGAWLVVRPGLGRLRYVLTSGAVGGALVAFWMLPFYGHSGYMTDMGWERITTFGDFLWNRDAITPAITNWPNFQAVLVVALVGLVLSIVGRVRAGLYLALLAAAFALAFVVVPGGRLWNARLLPFYYLAGYLTASVGVGLATRLLVSLAARRADRSGRSEPSDEPHRALKTHGGFVPVVAALLLFLVVGLANHNLPGGHTALDGTYHWGPLSTHEHSYLDSWVDWNFQGLEWFDQPVVRNAQGVVMPAATGGPMHDPVTYAKAYPEYYDLISTMKSVGAEHGCGRAMWEYEDQNNRYGSPMELMLLPFWTDGCIGSMEGLFFEASATTPYHFINQDELSAKPSDAERDLPYTSRPLTPEVFDQGVRHLQLMGVSYYLAVDETTTGFARQNPALHEIADSGPWSIFAVADAPVVAALTNQPAVLTGQPTTGQAWQDTSVCWYQNPGDQNVVLTDHGPADWQRVSRTVIPDPAALPADRCQPGNWGWFSAGGGPEVRSQPAADVTALKIEDDHISFDVSQIGVPILVKASYFPNWQAQGATGPYRSTPNFMVVVPTSTHVDLRYGYTPVDLAGWAITIVGLIGLVVLFRARPVAMSDPRPFWGRIRPGDRPDSPHQPDRAQPPERPDQPDRPGAAEVSP